jgi:ADP-ribose pyrophosphatase YjhB (NUDIX family)
VTDGTSGPTEPNWLIWAREIQALAQTGLAFTRDEYDLARYERFRTLAAQIMAQHTGLEERDIEAMFTQQTGYATPKVDVRGAVFRDGRILLVRETADGDRWTLPGGWADVNESPAEAVVKEVRE